MSRKKNKPSKNAAAVSPAEIPAGTTEVIAGPGMVVPTAVVTSTVVANDEKTVSEDGAATTSEPVASAESASAPAPATEPEAAPEGTPAEPAAAPVTEPEPAKAEETTPAAAAPKPRQGLFGYLRSLFY